MSETRKNTYQRTVYLIKNNSKLRLNLKKRKEKGETGRKIQTTSSGYSLTALLRKQILDKQIRQSQL